MALIAKETGSGDFTPIPEGMHHAICYGIYDLGTHFSEKFGKSAHKVLILWEIPNIRIDVEVGGEVKNLPKSISKQYTLSLNEKAILRKDLESWRGKRFSKDELGGFDLARLIGANCQLQILHHEKDGRVYSNIQTIVPVMQGMSRKPENEPRMFVFEESESTEIPAATPDWIRDILKQAEEYPDWHAKSAKETSPADEPPPAWMADAVQPSQGSEERPF